MNARLTIITVTEALPVDYGSGHASGWIPTQEEVDSFDAAGKACAGKVLDEARAMSEQIGTPAELLHVPNAHPATAIIETTKSRGCDLIVMASHGRRGLACRCWWCRSRHKCKAYAASLGCPAALPHKTALAAGDLHGQ
ncbi:universal stress protein [Bradyrhizobium sp. SSUT18]|uniref:universal stress protein n=1 Tax=unclassified Bradyrhizobium TaxID=2631580 RepID=UPI002447D9A7|nr:MULTISPECIES: universal stress protein [unclassified Bradyrhizobium]MDH2350195.1 universal stress protein [Bradyrhizobium sp. SSUT112]MDH2399717.1 universal stress protein [Bradyrhizobium sp. SSUT18]